MAQAGGQVARVGDGLTARGPAWSPRQHSEGLPPGSERGGLQALSLERLLLVSFLLYLLLFLSQREEWWGQVEARHPGDVLTSL